MGTIDHGSGVGRAGPAGVGEAAGARPRKSLDKLRALAEFHESMAAHYEGKAKSAARMALLHGGFAQLARELLDEGER